MAPRKITIIQGHPDPDPTHLCHALADSYAEGAESAGHEVRRVQVGDLDFPLLRTPSEWKDGAIPAALVPAQQAIAWADHLVIVYPLWLGTMPALLKAFLEQCLRPGFAVARADSPADWRTLLGGKSARVVVTMGMPALVYRWWFGAHSLKSLERNILHFVGIRPVRESLFGGVESVDAAQRARWLADMRAKGAAAR